MQFIDDENNISGSGDLIAVVGPAAIRIIKELLKLIANAIKMAMIRYGIIKEPLHKKFLRHAVEVLNWVKKSILNVRGIGGIVASIFYVKKLKKDFLNFTEEHGGTSPIAYIIESIDTMLNRFLGVFKSAKKKYETNPAPYKPIGMLGHDSKPSRRQKKDDLKETLKNVSEILSYMLHEAVKKISEILEGMKHSVNETTGLKIFKEKSFVQKALEHTKEKISNVLRGIKYAFKRYPTYIPLMLIAPVKSVLDIAKTLSFIGSIKTFKYWMIQRFGVDYTAYLKSYANRLAQFAKNKLLNLAVKIKHGTKSYGYDQEHGEYIDV